MHSMDLCDIRLVFIDAGHLGRTWFLFWILRVFHDHQNGIMIANWIELTNSRCEKSWRIWLEKWLLESIATDSAGWEAFSEKHVQKMALVDSCNEFCLDTNHKYILSMKLRKSHKHRVSYFYLWTVLCHTWHAIEMRWYCWLGENWAPVRQSQCEGALAPSNGRYTTATHERRAGDMGTGVILTGGSLQACHIEALRCIHAKACVVELIYWNPYNIYQTVNISQAKYELWLATFPIHKMC